ncbi:MAG: dTMP kinase [Acidobacteria bacterium]|nr:dTMP kinase [Acidobacteriota bacterium]
MNKVNTGGMFVTLEGVEGCGKSTQMDLLARRLADRGIPHVCTREPGGTPFGREVRRILLNPQGPPRAPLAELLLYLADRVQDLHQQIRPALAEGRIVLCDRYHDATIAYQGFGRGIPRPTIAALAAPLQLLPPDLTLLLDLPPEEALIRARRRNETDARARTESRFDDEAIAFHRRVQEGYRQLVREEPERFAVIPAQGTPERIFTLLLTRFVDALPPQLKRKMS